VDTDASIIGIGRVLSQIKDGQERVIAYYSRTLNKAERNVCVTRRELLAIVRTLEYFHNNFTYKNSTCAPANLRQPCSLVLRMYKDKQRVGFSDCKSTALLPSTAKAEAYQCNGFSRRLCHCHRVNAREDIKQVLAIAAVAVPPGIRHH
jgi:hypothetical protein